MPACLIPANNATQRQLVKPVIPHIPNLQGAKKQLLEIAVIVGAQRFIFTAAAPPAPIILVQAVWIDGVVLAHRIALIG